MDTNTLALAKHLDLSAFQVAFETGEHGPGCTCFGEPFPVLRIVRDGDRRIVRSEEGKRFTLAHDGMCEMCPNIDTLADYVVSSNGDPYACDVYYCESHMYDAIFVHGPEGSGDKWSLKPEKIILVDMYSGQLIDPPRHKAAVQ